MKKTILIFLLCIFIMSGCSNISSYKSNPDKNDQVPMASEGKTTDDPVSMSPSPTSVNSVPTPASPDPSKAENIHNETEEDASPATPDNMGKEGDSAEQTLKGRIICIDPGHGSPDIKGGQEKIAPDSDETKPALAYGAVGIKTGTPEYKISMIVSLILKDLFEEQGATVILTRKSDEENLGNIERAVIGNEAKADLVIRIHGDGSDNQYAQGVSVLYPGSKYISDNALLAQSKSAAQFLLDSIINATGAHPRGIVKREDLTGFNWSTRTTVLVEMGFLSNPKEDQLLNDPVYQKKIAAGIMEGVHEFFESEPK